MKKSYAMPSLELLVLSIGDDILRTSLEVKDSGMGDEWNLGDQS